MKNTLLAQNVGKLEGIKTFRSEVHSKKKKPKLTKVVFHPFFESQINDICTAANFSTIRLNFAKKAEKLEVC